MNMMPELQFPEFEPMPLLRDGHLMTIAPGLWPRRYAGSVGNVESREFLVERLESGASEGGAVDGGASAARPGDSRILARCSWQADRVNAPTLLLVHGLEGSSESPYVLGVAHKAFASGMNVLRLNLRNCGGTMPIASTLYHAGMSGDIRAVIHELEHVDGLRSFAIAGFSLGGNIVVKAAAELSRAGDHKVHAVVAISPSLDLQRCVLAILKPENRVYDQFFCHSLKKKIRDKARQQPGRYDLSKLAGVKNLFQFDDVYTSVHGGFVNAVNYYGSQSALQFIDQITIPTLLIASQDDPLVPFAIFGECEAIAANPQVKLLAPKHGGHTGFLARSREDGSSRTGSSLFDSHWAENRCVQFALAACKDPLNRYRLNLSM